MFERWKWNPKNWLCGYLWDFFVNCYQSNKLIQALMILLTQEITFSWHKGSPVRWRLLNRSSKPFAVSKLGTTSDNNHRRHSNSCVVSRVYLSITYFLDSYSFVWNCASSSFTQLENIPTTLITYSGHHTNMPQTIHSTCLKRLFSLRFIDQLFQMQKTIALK